MKDRLGGILPVILIQFFVLAFVVLLRPDFESWGFNTEVLIMGNALLCIITIASFFVAKSGLKHKNPNVFVRSVMGSIMVKMFLCVIIAFIYISVNKQGLNKPALFTCMGLYLVYTFTEVYVLMKLAKQGKNA